jgi:iron complex outermembrane recepter protein
LAATFQAIEDLRFRNRSAEFRITSPQSSALRGQGGLYWFDERSKARTRTLGSSPITFRPDGADFTVSTTENFAVFGQLQWQIGDALTVSGEARWAREKRAVSTTRPAAATFKSFTPRVTVDYKLSDRSMLYALVAKGNKPGGFNTALYSATGVSAASFTALRAQGFDRFQEETAITYEVGGKFGFADGRATLNLSGFYIDWRDQQLNRIVDIVRANNTVGTAAILVNAGKSRIVAWKPN